MQKKLLVFGIAGMLAIAVACGGDKTSPVSPSSSGGVGTDAGADGSTLKVSAPTPVSPIDNVMVTSRRPSLVAGHATGTFVVVTGLTYQFEVVSGSAVVPIYTVDNMPAGSADRSTHTLTTDLASGATYRWRARAKQGTLAGPWSSYATFQVKADPFSIAGYQTNDELWDPLVNGVTIGNATGMEFVPGEGARTISTQSYIRYGLLQTMGAGEFSFYAYNLNPMAEGSKTKLMSMAEGDSDITTNDYRFTIEKRGIEYPTPGQVRIRVINGEGTNPANIHDATPAVAPLVKARWYFVKTTWGSNMARFQIRADSPTGAVVFSSSVAYQGRQYGPVPHVAFVGSPRPRGSINDQSIPNMTVKGVFIGRTGVIRPTVLDGPGGFDQR